MAYFEICEQLLAIGPQDGGGPWKHETDDIGSPFMVRGDQWVGYDDPSSINLKVSYFDR
jgi:chitinase